MSLQKIIVPGDFFLAEIAYAIPIAGNQLIPVGQYLAIPDVSGQLQFNRAGVWTNMAPLATGGFIVSDGVNVRVLNTSGAVVSNLYLEPLN